jgi:adenylate cyclase class 2
MGTEIELKARLGSKEGCLARLEAIAGQGAPFVKDDAYWFPGGGPSRSGLRVRREKTAGKETTLVTWKIKEKRDGMEVNDEKEIAVSCGALFEELLYSLGLRKRITKHKEGWAWNIDGVTAELAEVSGSSKERISGSSYKEGISGSSSGFSKEEIADPSREGTPVTLGWFLELEILDCGDEHTARRRLLDLLAKAGVDEAAIENRYYSELLVF